MKISDLLIIYFSIGAPAAAQFYLQNRAQPDRIKLWRETVFTFLFWIPAAFRFFSVKGFFRSRVFFNGSNKISPSGERAENLRRLQKEFEKILTASDCRCSVFEFRETLERYVGLTLASQAATGEGDEEFFLAAKNKNSALAARCFERRNRQRLLSHQTAARGDFLQILSRLSAQVSDERAHNFFARSREYVKILGDYDAEKAVEKLFAAAAASPAEIVEKEKSFFPAASASRL